MTRRPVQARAKHTRNLTFVVMCLLALGSIFISNTSTVYSQNIYNDPYKFTFLHLAWVGLGTVLFFLVSRVDYHIYEKYALSAIIAGGVLLAFLALMGILPCDSNMPFAPCINGANRWLYVNPEPLPRLPFVGVLTFQPAEFIKFIVVIFMAFQLDKYKRSRGSEAFYVYAVTTVLLCGLIVLQPNMSNAALIFTICTFIYFLSGADLKPFLVFAPVCLLIGLSAILIFPHSRQRVMSLVGAHSAESQESYQVRQVLISLGSGGFTGVGLGQSKQKFSYLPEIASDSIFAVIGEEVGFLGTSLILVLFVYFIYVGLKIASVAPDLPGSLIASGITCWVGFQALINAAAMSQVIPLTGMPMPLISYGGSSMLFTLVGLGVLSNISRNTQG